MYRKGVAFITPWFGEFAGGAESLVRNSSIELKKRGINVIILTTCSRSPYDSWWEDFYIPEKKEENGLMVYRYRLSGNREKYENIINKISNNEDLCKKDMQDFYVNGINSKDLVDDIKNLKDEYEFIAIPYFHGVVYSAIKNHPNLISMIPCFHNELQFYWDTTKEMLKKTKKIFFNTEEEKTQCIKTYGLSIGRKIIKSPVVGVGVEVEIPEEFYIENKNQKYGDYIVYIGRKERGKNFDLLCDYFIKYKEINKSDLKLITIGGGDNSLIPERDDIIDLGFLNVKEKYDLLNNALVLCNLSENESFSIVLMEAWLKKIPVIVSGKCEVTKGHCIRSNGGLYPENEEEFILCLDFLLKENAIRKYLSESGYTYVKENFSFDTVLYKYLKELGVLE